MNKMIHSFWTTFDYLLSPTVLTQYPRDHNDYPNTVSITTDSGPAREAQAFPLETTSIWTHYT
jgi:hypothetical protein